MYIKKNIVMFVCLNAYYIIYCDKMGNWHLFSSIVTHTRGAHLFVINITLLVIKFKNGSFITRIRQLYHGGMLLAGNVI